MSNEEFAQKYCLTEICNDKQISYLKEGCASLVSAIGDKNASNIYAHQKAAKKYPYFSAVTQELFDCGDFYAPAVKKINKKIAAHGVDFKFEQLHPAIQALSLRILALGQEKYASIIGNSIAKYVKSNPKAIDYITAKEINEQMKNGLLKTILKPRPKVIKIVDSLESKPLEYWMESEYLYNTVNGGSSDTSWFALRKKESRSKEREALDEINREIANQFKSGFYATSDLQVPKTFEIDPAEIASLTIKTKKSNGKVKPLQRRPINVKDIFAKAKKQAENNQKTLAEVRKAHRRTRAALRQEEEQATNTTPQTPQIEKTPPSEKEIVAMIKQDLASNNKKLKGRREAKQAQRNLDRFNNDEAYRNAVIAAYKVKLSQRDKV